MERGGGGEAEREKGARADNCLVNIWGLGMAIKQECSGPSEAGTHRRAYPSKSIQVNLSVSAGWVFWTGDECRGWQDEMPRCQAEL